MPRPITLQSSSRRTALVVVEPRSMPTKVFMHPPSRCRARTGAFLLNHLEVALETVLDVGGREIARIDQVGLDERRRLAGAFLDLAHHQQLAGREAVAALDRIDRQAAIGVDAETIFGQRL